MKAICSCISRRQANVPVDIIDVHDQATQKAAGLALFSLPPENLPFVVGSSGVEYALMAALGKSRSAVVSAGRAGRSTACRLRQRLADHRTPDRLCRGQWLRGASRRCA